MATTVIKIEGMTCGHCTQAAEEAVTALAGVQSASANLETGEVSVVQDGTVSEDALKNALEEIGFDAV